MVQVTLEIDEIGAREVEEEIGSFRMKVPEGVSSAPERMLFVYPFALFFVLLKINNGVNMDVIGGAAFILPSIEHQGVSMTPALFRSRRGTAARKPSCSTTLGVIKIG